MGGRISQGVDEIIKFIRRFHRGPGLRAFGGSTLAARVMHSHAFSMSHSFSARAALVEVHLRAMSSAMAVSETPTFGRPAVLSKNKTHVFQWFNGN